MPASKPVEGVSGLGHHYDHVRDRAMAVILPATALLCFFSGLQFQPLSESGEYMRVAFYGFALYFLLVLLAARSRRFSVSWIGFATGCGMAAVVLMRIVSVNLELMAFGETTSVSNPIYAYVPLVLALVSMLVPHPLSVLVSVAIWLVTACVTSALVFHLVQVNPLVFGVKPLMVLVWLGYPTILAVLDYAARWRVSMIDLYAQKALGAEEANARASQQAAELNSVFQQAASGIAVVGGDGRVLSVNSGLTRITGYSDLELKNLDLRNLVHPDDREISNQMRKRLLSRELDNFHLEVRYAHKQGHSIWVKYSVGRIDDKQGERYVIVVDDISDRKRNEQQLEKLSTELEDRVVERTQALKEARWQWQQRSEKLAKITEVLGLLPSAEDERDACKIVASCLPGIFPGSTGRLMLVDERGSEFRDVATWGGVESDQPLEIIDCWSLRSSQQFRTDFSSVGADRGLVCPHHHPDTTMPGNEGDARICHPFLVNGETLGLLTIRWSSEQSQQVQLDAEALLVATVGDQVSLTIANLRLRRALIEQSLRDPLTGLNNRRLLIERMKHEIALAEREGQPFSVLMLDVDHFKRFNDDHGHELGDQVLIGVGSVLKETQRGSDDAFRFGGEEFIELLGNTPLAGAVVRAENIRTAVQQITLHSQAGEIPPVTCSIGVACYPDDGATAETLLESADRAMYKAKKSGRNNVKTYRGDGQYPRSIER